MSGINAREQAINEVLSRRIRKIEPPRDENGRQQNVSEFFRVQYLQQGPHAGQTSTGCI